MLGRYFYKQYGELLDKQDSPLVLSTDYYRTIQSGYSELLGMKYEKLQEERPVLSQK